MFVNEMSGLQKILDHFLGARRWSKARQGKAKQGLPQQQRSKSKVKGIHKTNQKTKRKKFERKFTPRINHT